MVSVYYIGMLENGQKFDFSCDWGQFIEFLFGVGYVIFGWDQGIVQMWVGDKVWLIIFGYFVYGEVGVFGVIFFNVILIFDVELMDVC